MDQKWRWKTLSRAIRNENIFAVCEWEGEKLIKIEVKYSI